MKKPSKRFRAAAIVLFILAVAAGCDYARMSEQESIRAYETSIPEMPKGTLSTTGGIQILKDTDPENLKNPIPDSVQAAAQGKIKYGYYCVMCHGPEADGVGTVGQSFYPLPTNLKSTEVQNRSDGYLYKVITLGGRRSPPLAATVGEEDRWLIVRYIRSLNPEAVAKRDERR